MKDRSASYKYTCANGTKASNLLEFLSNGGGDEESLRALAENILVYVESRRDCADFRAAYLVRILYSYAHMLPADIFDRIKEDLLAFPYEDCGGHSMCTWTENHRLYASGTEYLLAKLFPEAVFGDGRRATYHRVHGEGELIVGLEEILKFGFAEWGSNNYYSETMAGLANLVQFADSGTVRDNAEKVLKMMVYDVLSQTYYSNGYVYNPACGRAYADNKTGSDLGNYLEPQIMAMRDEKVTRFKEKEGCMVLLLKEKDRTGNYLFKIPDEWKKLPDREEREICLVQGLDIDDYADHGYKIYSPSNVRFAFKAGAISDYRVICNSMRYLKESELIGNHMLKALKPFASPLLYRTGLLKLLKKAVPTGFDGAAMEEGRVYTYVCKNYSVSAAFDYRVGQVLFQQNPLAINMGYRISLCVTNPYSEKNKKGSPGYWIGSGIAPRAVAYRNFAACLFDLKNAKKELKFTHMFFPTGLFDEVDLEELEKGLIFGRAGEVNVCVRFNPGARFVPAAESLEQDKALYQDGKIPEGYYDKEYDLINLAEGIHYYAFELDEELEFKEFKERARKRRFAFAEEEKALYCDLYDCKVVYDGDFTVNGKKFIPEFKRLGEAVSDML